MPENNHVSPEAGTTPESVSRRSLAHRRTSLVSKYRSQSQDIQIRPVNEKGISGDCPGDAAVLNGEGRVEFDGKAICATGPLASLLPSSGFSPLGDCSRGPSQA